MLVRGAGVSLSQWHRVLLGVINPTNRATLGHNYSFVFFAAAVPVLLVGNCICTLQILPHLFVYLVTVTSVSDSFVYLVTVTSVSDSFVYLFIVTSLFDLLFILLLLKLMFLRCAGDGRPTMFVAVAGRSNGLGPTVSGNTSFPVINCPPLSADWAAQDIWSSLRLPSGQYCMPLSAPYCQTEA